MSFEQRLLVTQHAVIIVDAQKRSVSEAIEHPYEFPTPTAMIDDVRRPGLVKFAHFSRQLLYRLMLSVKQPGLQSLPDDN